MHCADIQELLRSVYLDHQMSAGEERYITGHLKTCPECRKLKEELDSQRAVFSKLKEEKVPERIWENIRARIVSEQFKEENAGVGLLERLRLLWQPRPVFALSGAFTLVVVILLLVGLSRSISRQDNVIQYLSEYSINIEDDDSSSGLGTYIEEYFL
jgi:predicted anti-sigma-YlaC factor YlaD